MVQNPGSAELLQEVAGRLVSVEEGLAALDNHKTALHNHAIKVKGQINSAVEHHMATLRAKEKQLIRQVEVANTHQNSEVNVTQAQLLQHKGALSVTRTILDNCSTAATTDNTDDTCDGKGSSMVGYNNIQKHRVGEFNTTVSNTIATTVNCMPHQDVAGLLEHTEKLMRVPLVSVSLDDTGLGSAIQKYGRVSSPPILSHSELLPHDLEEYGDDEHHVLHKSVQQPGMAFATAIDVRRPYILAATKMHNINKAANNKQMPVECNKESKEDLVKWLHRMQLDNNNTTDDTAYDTQSNASCCGANKGCLDICIEEACQANEICSTFSNCLMSGQCKKNALEKTEQSSKWQQHEEAQIMEKWCTPRKQHKADETCANFQQLANSYTPNPPLKRMHPNSNEAIKSVVAHMNEILNSNNESWLLGKRNESTGMDHSAVLKWMEQNHIESSFKKMKLDNNPATLDNNISNNIRSAVLYIPPNSDWVLSPTEEKALETKTAPIFEVMNTNSKEKDDNIGWLLPATETNSNKGSAKKANCDKENNLCRASLMKSQLSLNNFGSIENLKDKIMENKASELISDIEAKESWLLHQDEQFDMDRIDNKILENVLNMNSDWLSETSLTSFSIITDPADSNNHWLVNQQI